MPSFKRVKLFFVLFLLSFCVFFLVEPTSAQITKAIKCIENPNNTEFGEDLDLARCIECDVCGYCFTQPERNMDMPDDWAKCAQCLYPDIFQEAGLADVSELENKDAMRNLTLEIGGGDNGNVDMPKPKKGRYYTQLGCFSTDGDDYFDAFAGGSGAGGPVSQLLNVLFSVVGSLAFLYMLYGAFVFMTAQGAPENIQKGKGIITGAIVGLVFSLSSILLINLISNDILKIPGLGNSVVDVKLKSIEDSDNKLVTFNPKGKQFTILELHYDQGSVKCSSQTKEVAKISAGSNENIEYDIIICTTSGAESFGGNNFYDVVEIGKDTEIIKVILDGQVEVKP
jgi:hypothetical protein